MPTDYGVFYCTREKFMRAFDVQPSLNASSQADDAILSGSRATEGFLHRVFYPWTGTRYLDFPNRQHTPEYRVWLDEDEIISLSSLVSNGVTIPSYYLKPNSGPPYTYIELPRSSSYTFGGGTSPQRDIAMTGVFGHSAIERPAGTVNEALDATETAVDVLSYSAGVGVGSILRVDDERLMVTETGWVASGQAMVTLDLTANRSSVALQVTDGTVFYAGETLLVDSERILVTEVAGNVLTVQRAQQGSILAAHSGAALSWPRRLTVTRGALGTTAATHLTAAPLYRHVVPPLAEQLAQAYAETYLLQNATGWARTIGPAGGGSEGGEGQVAGRGLRRIEDAAYAQLGRKVRARAV